MTQRIDLDNGGHIKIDGFLGGPKPDQICITAVDGTIGSSLCLPPMTAREFWGKLGDELKAFDEAAGEPSN